MRKILKTIVGYGFVMAMVITIIVGVSFVIVDSEWIDTRLYLSECLTNGIVTTVVLGLSNLLITLCNGFRKREAQ